MRESKTVPQRHRQNFQPNICSKNTLDFEASDNRISMYETSPSVGLRLLDPLKLRFSRPQSRPRSGPFTPKFSGRKSCPRPPLQRPDNLEFQCSGSPILQRQVFRLPCITGNRYGDDENVFPLIDSDFGVLPLRKSNMNCALHVRFEPRIADVIAQRSPRGMHLLLLHKCLSKSTGRCRRRSLS